MDRTGRLRAIEGQHQPQDTALNAENGHLPGFCELRGLKIALSQFGLLDLLSEVLPWPLSLSLLRQEKILF